MPRNPSKDFIELIKFPPTQPYRTLPYTSPQHAYLLRHAPAYFKFQLSKPTSNVLNVVFAYKSNSFMDEQFTYFQSMYNGVVPFISPILCDREIIRSEKPCTKVHGKK